MKEKGLFFALICVIVVLLFSLLSLFKLWGLPDSNSIALRIINRNTILLSLAVFSIIRYLQKKV